MRTIRVTFVRTFSRLWVSWTALVGTVAFLALSGMGFVRALMRGDGGSVPVAALWALSAVPFLPVMAALVNGGAGDDAPRGGRAG